MTAAFRAFIAGLAVLGFPGALAAALEIERASRPVSKRGRV